MADFGKSRSGNAPHFSARARLVADLSFTLDGPALLEAIESFDEFDLREVHGLEAVCLEILQPAARYLGECWTQDSCNFLDVTYAIFRLQDALRLLAARAPSHRAMRSPGARRVLFAPMPGDQHDFGPQMLDKLFAADGWNSTVLVQPLRREILEAVMQESFDLVGLTLSRDCPSAAISGLIEAVRGASLNPDLAVLIGGRMVNLNPAIVAEVGADGTGTDARAALAVAQSLVQSRRVHAHMT